MPELYKISDIKSPSEEDLDYGVELLLEAEKIDGNEELLKNIQARAGDKSKEYKSIKDLREVSDELNLNPGKDRVEEVKNEKGKNKVD